MLDTSSLWSGKFALEFRSLSSTLVKLNDIVGLVTDNAIFNDIFVRLSPGGTPRKTGWGVRPASQNAYLFT